METEAEEDRWEGWLVAGALELLGEDEGEQYSEG